MNIGEQTWVRLAYQLHDDEDTLIEQGDQLTYLHGGYHMIFPPVEAALAGKQVGDEIEVEVAPESAFGLYNLALMKVEPRTLFPETVEVGMLFEGDALEDGLVPIYRVTDVDDEHVVVDANHPLAGVTLRFKARVAELRMATADEVDQVLQQQVQEGMQTS